MMTSVLPAAPATTGSAQRPASRSQGDAFAATLEAVARDHARTHDRSGRPAEQHAEAPTADVPNDDAPTSDAQPDDAQHSLVLEHPSALTPPVPTGAAPESDAGTGPATTDPSATKPATTDPSVSGLLAAGGPRPAVAPGVPGAEARGAASPAVESVAAQSAGPEPAAAESADLAAGESVDQEQSGTAGQPERRAQLADPAAAGGPAATAARAEPPAPGATPADTSAAAAPTGAAAAPEVLAAAAGREAGAQLPPGTVPLTGGPGTTETDASAPVPPRPLEATADAERPAPEMALRGTEGPSTNLRAETVAKAEPAPSTPPGTQPQALSSQLASTLSRLRTAPEGHHVLNIRVDPDDLGPVRVTAHIGTEGVRIELVGMTEAARDALRGTLTELRRELAATGLDADLDLASDDQPSQQRRPEQPVATAHPQVPDSPHDPRTAPVGHRGLDLLA